VTRLGKSREARDGLLRDSGFGEKKDSSGKPIGFDKVEKELIKPAMETSGRRYIVSGYG